VKLQERGISCWPLGTHSLLQSAIITRHCTFIGGALWTLVTDWWWEWELFTLCLQCLARLVMLEERTQTDVHAAFRGTEGQTRWKFEGKAALLEMSVVSYECGTGQSFRFRLVAKWCLRLLTHESLGPLKVFYARQHLYTIARRAYMVSPVRPSVCIRHTGGSVRNGWS